jgi:hypothetical protein
VDQDLGDMESLAMTVLARDGWLNLFEIGQDAFIGPHKL